MAYITGLSIIMVGLIVACVVLLVQNVHHVSTQEEYISYRPGENGCGIILTAPHGGYLEPSSIPDRGRGCRIGGSCVYTHDCGTPSDRCRTVTTRDGYTKELTFLLEAELINLGCTPHVIVNNLARVKLDANRDIEMAAFGDPEAVAAYNEWTDYIMQARAAVGTGVLFDIHGVRSHDEEWIEVGYRISKTQLNENDLDPADSSIRSLAGSQCGRGSNSDCFENLVRGQYSFGQILAAQNPGQRVIPSVDDPSPGDGGYYRGGYTTDTHGSKYGGNVDAIQIESPAPLRSRTTTPAYARKLAAAIKSFYDRYYS